MITVTILKDYYSSFQPLIYLSYFLHICINDSSINKPDLHIHVLGNNRKDCLSRMSRFILETPFVRGEPDIFKAGAIMGILSRSSFSNWFDEDNNLIGNDYPSFTLDSCL